MKHLILGGARSGKSLFAENMTLTIHAQKAEQQTNAQLIYVATSPNLDDEMNQRIVTHKARRSTQWQNIECQIDIATILQNAAPEATILIDCLTLWLNNLTYENKQIDAEFAKLCEAVSHSKADVIFVSNEIGMGLVPETEIGRKFRDQQGQINQLIAQKVDKVALIVAGLPLWVR